jgi:hypothetical protein
MNPAPFPYLMRTAATGNAGLAPLLPITLQVHQQVSALGMLDTGAALNVLPYSLGLQLGADWDQQTTILQLSGNLAAVEARGIVVSAVVRAFPAVQLAFAWAKTDSVPLLLGQVNFFMEFDVCFFRSRGLFEVASRRP